MWLGIDTPNLPKAQALLLPRISPRSATRCSKSQNRLMGQFADTPLWAIETQGLRGRYSHQNHPPMTNSTWCPHWNFQGILAMALDLHNLSMHSGRMWTRKSDMPCPARTWTWLFDHCQMLVNQVVNNGNLVMINSGSSRSIMVTE